MSSPAQSNDPLKRLKDIAELIKLLAGLISSIVIPIISWRDRTFFGLLNVQPDFGGKNILNWVVFISFCILALQLIVHWGFWRLARPKRKISRTGLRRTLYILFIAVPATAFLFNLLIYYIDEHPEIDSLFMDYSLRALYILLITVPVYLASKLVIFAYPDQPPAQNSNTQSTRG
jgi:hypothetical protein